MAQQISEFLRDGGDRALLYNYPNLTEDSIVFDVGGYVGEWSTDLQDRGYKGRLLVFELVKQFFDELVYKFQFDENVELYQFGLSSETRTVDITLKNNSSTIYATGGPTEQIELVSINDFIKDFDSTIDLIKLNVEGEEYNILEALIESDQLDKFNNILVQFHNIDSDSDTRRAKIQEALRKTHSCVFDYEFVWESWTR